MTDQQTPLPENNLPKVAAAAPPPVPARVLPYPPDGPNGADSAKPAQEAGSITLIRWSIMISAYIGIIGLGGVYGVTAHKFFAAVFAVENGTNSALMLWSFLAGVPLAIGGLCTYAATQAKRALQGGQADTSILGASFIAALAAAFFAFAGGALLREGAICIVMALPLFIFMALLGVLIIVLSSAFGAKANKKVLGLMLLFPFAAAPFEQRATPGDAFQQVNRSVLIAASPTEIWQHINFPLDIKPNELKSGFAYKIGVPYPIEARTIEPRVGGTRQLQWERGVKFEEIITAWDENRHVAWKYKFDKNSFPEGSLDDHIVIGGRYFDLEDTSYTLTPEAGGTRLSIAVKSRVTTTFNWYAGAWAAFLIDDTAQAILLFYKNRAERTSASRIDVHKMTNPGRVPGYGYCNKYAASHHICPMKMQ